MATYEYVRPWLYPAQKAAIFDALDVNGKPARYALIEASTKAGKTSACIAWLFEQAAAAKKPGHNYWWVAPIFSQAKIAFRRMKRGLPAGIFVANQGDMTITLLNGAIIWFKSADTPDSLYGDDVHAAVLDEASRMKEDAWIAVRSTVTSTRGPLRIIGNVRGRINWFWRMARRAEAGEPDLAFAKLTAFDAVAGGVLAADEIEDAKRQLPEQVFRELYMAEASDDAGNPFGQDHIRACTVSALSEGPTTAIGVDLAKSVDWTVVVGLDRNMVVSGFERWQRVPWGETQERILGLVGHTPSLVDSTGVGDPVVEAMQRKRPGTIESFTFSSASKQKLMEGLALAIQSRRVRFPDGAIRAELDAFEFVTTRTGVRYSAPTGYHDDCVMALALAVQKHAGLSQSLMGSVVPGGSTRISPWLGGSMSPAHQEF